MKPKLTARGTAGHSSMIQNKSHWVVLILVASAAVFWNLSQNSFYKPPSPSAALERQLDDCGDQTTTDRIVSHPTLTPQFCEANPYLKSLLPGTSYDSIDQKAQTWLETNHRRDLLQKMIKASYGRNVHKKFDAFDEMAACNYTCIGGECKSDQSKIMCGTDTLLELQEPESTCIIYSIGGNNQWRFEEDMHRITPCEIHTFDCTGDIARFQPPPDLRDSNRHHFHHVCLSHQYIAKPQVQKDGPVIKAWAVQGEMMTLEMIQEQLNHTRLDLLKMDIEGYEFPIMDSWPELSDTTSKVALPMQILVELHSISPMSDLRIEGQQFFKDEVDLVAFQEHLLRMGYAVAVRDDNRKCSRYVKIYSVVLVLRDNNDGFILNFLLLVR